MHNLTRYGSFFVLGCFFVVFFALLFALYSPVLVELLVDAPGDKLLDKRALGDKALV